MHLTQETDYSMRIIYCLAKSGKRMDAASISEEMHISLRFSLKILGKLAGAGLVNSYKGMRGGYELARPADQITLKEVLDVAEGHSYALSRCLCEGENCNRGMSGCCVFQDLWFQLTGQVNRTLSGITFADMLAREAQRSAGKDAQPVGTAG